MRAPNLGAPELRHSRSVGAALVAVALALVLGTGASVLVPSLQIRVTSLALELVLYTISVVVTIVVAMLSWVRFREDREPITLFQAAAFAVLAVGSAAGMLFLIGNLRLPVGRGVQDPGQTPLYLFTLTHVVAAGLLVAGGLASGRSAWHGRAVALMAGSVSGMLVVAVLIRQVVNSLPPLVVLERTGSGLAGLERSVANLTPLGAAAELLAGALFLAAAFLAWRQPNPSGSYFTTYRTLGFIFAAFSQTFGAGETVGAVTAGDVLRLAFDVTLLFGVLAESRGALRQLRGANDTLTRLSRVEVDRGALEERARLSRELHDGLAQELWVAKLKSGRLAALPELGVEARALSEEIERALDAGLADAQQAVAALRLSGTPTGTLSELLARTVTEFGDRFGLRVEFAWDAGVAQLPPRVQAEALRVVQEALTNIRRHADATVARVHARIENGSLVLVVADNGKGFDLDTVGRSAYGLASMRERAALIGGQLEIDSRPRDGTRLSLVVPLKLPGALGAARTS